MNQNIKGKWEHIKNICVFVFYPSFCSELSGCGSVPYLPALDWPEASSGSPANCSLPLACIALLNNSPSLHYMTKYSFVSNISNIHTSQRTSQLLVCSEETTFLHKIPCTHIPVLAEAHKACFSFTLGKPSLWIITALKSWLCTIPS